MKRTGPSPKVCGVVMARDGGRCRRCGAIGEQIHHRRPRGIGGTSDPMINDPSNLVLLCADDHRWVESNREQCYIDGWLLRHTRELPSEVPLVDLQGRTFFLTEEGTVIDLRRVRSRSGEGERRGPFGGTAPLTGGKS